MAIVSGSIIHSQSKTTGQHNWQSQPNTTQQQSQLLQSAAYNRSQGSSPVLLYSQVQVPIPSPRQSSCFSSRVQGSRAPVQSCCVFSPVLVESKSSSPVPVPEAAQSTISISIQNKIQFNPIQFILIWFQFNSIQFNSIQFNSIQFNFFLNK